MQPSRLWIVAALACAAPIIASAPALADDVEDMGFEFDRVLRSGSMYVDEPMHLDPDRAAETVGKLADVIARMEKAKADAPKLPEMKKALEEFKGKAELAVVTLVKKDFEQERSSFQRHYDQFAGPDARGGAYEAQRFAQAGTDTIARAKKVLDDARPRLTSGPGKAFLEEGDKWVADAKAKIGAAGLMAEARKLISEEKVEVRDHGRATLDWSLKQVADDLDSEKPEDALAIWDAAKQLVKAVQDPRFAALDDVKAILEQYKKVEARVAAELKPMLAKARVGPLIETAKSRLQYLNEKVDSKEVEGALQARGQLREACVELRKDWSDNPDAKAFLAEVDKGFARSDEEMGDGLALAEIEVVEKQVKPQLERLVRALDRKAATQVRRYAPSVKEKMEGLRPYANKSRAKNLLDACEQALARLEKEMGPSIKKQIEEEEWWPRVEVDYSAPSDVQRACIEINDHVKRMHEGYAEKQKRFEEVVDLVNGTNSHQYDQVWRDVEGEATSLVESARRLEKMGSELAKLDRKNAGVDIVSKAVPKLIKRANAWKELLGKKIDYASEIGKCNSMFDDAQNYVKDAREGNAERAANNWPRVIEKMDTCMTDLEAAMKLLPDDKEEANDWAARVKALRAEAEKCMIEACFSGATEAALTGNASDAKWYADALKRALPKSPENDKLAKIIAGGADARTKCDAEIRQRDDLLRQRAVEAAKAMSEKYEAWKTEKAPQVVLAGTILGNLGKWKGKFVTGHYSRLSDGYYDDFLEINGEIYRVNYAPEVKAGAATAVKKFTGLHEQMLAAVQKKNGVPPFGAGVGFLPEDADFVCEITGATSYVPVHEVRDSSGTVVGSITGTPYQVPMVVLRGLSAKYFVVVPGVGASADALNAEGIVP